MAPEPAGRLQHSHAGLKGGQGDEAAGNGCGCGEVLSEGAFLPRGHDFTGGEHWGERLGGADREEVRTLSLRPPTADRFEYLVDTLVQGGRQSGADERQAMAISLGTA